jgi:hypothetical protein
VIRAPANYVWGKSLRRAPRIRPGLIRMIRTRLEWNTSPDRKLSAYSTRLSIGWLRERPVEGGI